MRAGVKTENKVTILDLVCECNLEYALPATYLQPSCTLQNGWRLNMGLKVDPSVLSFPRFFVVQQVAFMPPVFPDVAQ
jgi:hypothetical protein